MRSGRTVAAIGPLAVAMSLVLGGIDPGLAQTGQPAVPSSPTDRNLPAASTTPTAPEQKPQGLTFDDGGGNVRAGDFTWTFWGYGERIFNTGPGKDYWRRFRHASHMIVTTSM